MAPRNRKRVYAVRRAPDGSAFEKCEGCGMSVAVALADMHECEPTKAVKRFRGVTVKQPVANQSFGDQPVSPFRLFMESFLKACNSGTMIEIDRKGFETWKNMSNEQRQPHVFQAGKVNSAYQQTLDKEVNDMIQNYPSLLFSMNMRWQCLGAKLLVPMMVDDEADSTMAGKFDKFHQFSEESSDCFEYYSDFSDDDCFFSD